MSLSFSFVNSLPRLCVVLPHWQTRLENNLPVASGRSPFGWDWGDKAKTFYLINPEEAALRFSIFHMFVNLDMSMRGIAHKLTEDGILPPSKSRGSNVRSTAWGPSTIHMLLRDVANIGVLQICKSTHTTKENGRITTLPNSKMKTIPDGLPAIVPVEMYQLAQLKLKANKSDKSHLHRNLEDFLLRGRVFCKTCNYRLIGRYRTSRKTHTYPFYACSHTANKYDACSSPVMIRTSGIDMLVWEDCCRVFERLDLIRDTIEHSIEQSLQNVLEDTRGVMLVSQLNEEIAFAKEERAKHPEGCYYYNLISHDIREKEERLHKYEEEYKESLNIVKVSSIYQKSILGFLEFLGSMRGKYHAATFQEKRNALDVLGVKVYLLPDTQENCGGREIDTDQEWFTVKEISEITGLKGRTLGNYIFSRKIEANRNVSPKVVHRDEVNRFLRESSLHPRAEIEEIRSRIEITYTPIFTGVQSSFG